MLSRVKPGPHPLHGEAGDMIAVGMFIPECSESEVVVEIELLQFYPGTGFHITRNESEDNCRIGRQCLQKLPDAGIKNQLCLTGGFFQFGGEKTMESIAVARA